MQIIAEHRLTSTCSTGDAEFKTAFFRRNFTLKVIQRRNKNGDRLKPILPFTHRYNLLMKLIAERIPTSTYSTRCGKFKTAFLLRNFTQNRRLRTIW